MVWQNWKTFANTHIQILSQSLDLKFSVCTRPVVSPICIWPFLKRRYSGCNKKKESPTLLCCVPSLMQIWVIFAVSHTDSTTHHTKTSGAIISAAFLHLHTVISLCFCKIGVLFIHEQLPPHQAYFSHIHVNFFFQFVL